LPEEPARSVAAPVFAPVAAAETVVAPESLIPEEVELVGVWREEVVEEDSMEGPLTPLRAAWTLPARPYKKADNSSEKWMELAKEPLNAEERATLAVEVKT